MGKVEYWYSDDAFCRAESALRRAIGRYASTNRWIYIGLTQQDPKKRFSKHQSLWCKGHKWDRMIVIYHARTLSLMQLVEDRLQKYANKQIKSKKYNCELIMEKASQRPRIAQNPNGYWVYILVQQ